MKSYNLQMWREKSNREINKNIKIKLNIYTNGKIESNIQNNGKSVGSKNRKINKKILQ